ncbi:hypothetical protein [Prochlorococcus sp. MIT 0603]
MEITPDFAKECREDALRKYEDEQQKVGLKMMMMGYYKAKSLLSEEGLKKVFEIDKKRASDEVFNKEFSQKMWLSTEEVWSEVLGKLMIKVTDAYGLKREHDIKFDLPDEDPNLDFFV